MSHQTYPSGTDPKTIPWDTPYKTPPEGQVSDFDHPDYSLRNAIIITSAVTLAAAVVATAARFWTRMYIVRRIGWDDYLTFVAFALVVSFNAAALMRVPHGLGVPTWDQRIVNYLERDQAPFVYWFIIMNILRHFALMLLKLSILALYLRILGGASALYRKTRWVVILTMVWVVGYNMGTLGWLLGLCDPPGKLLYPKRPGNCRYSGLWKELSAWSALNVFTDFLIFFTPLPMVWDLQMPMSQKVATVITLATGLMVCAATIVNLVISVSIIQQKSTEDPLQLWAIIEMNIGMMVVSFPAMRQLFARAITRIESLSGRSASKEISSDESGNDPKNPNGRKGAKRLGAVGRTDRGSNSDILLTQEVKQFDEENTIPKSSHPANGEAWGLQGHGFVFADVAATPAPHARTTTERDQEMGMSTFVYAK